MIITTLVAGVVGVTTTIGTYTVPSVGLGLLVRSGVKQVIKKGAKAAKRTAPKVASALNTASNLVVTEYNENGEIITQTWDGKCDGKWIDITRNSDGDVIDVDLTGYTRWGSD